MTNGRNALKKPATKILMENKRMNNDVKKIQSQYQSEFDHHYACWACNHNGWRKQKRMNHKIAMKKDRRIAKNKLRRVNAYESIYNFSW